MIGQTVSNLENSVLVNTIRSIRLVVIVVILIWCTGSCTASCGVVGNIVAEEAIDAVVPDGRWETIRLTEIIDSDDKFKGDNIRFHLVNGGYNDVIVERVDSTFVYAWIHWNDNIRKHLTKIRLSRVTKAEYWVSGADQLIQ